MDLFELINIVNSERKENGLHFHKCDNCGFIWEHSDLCVNEVPAHTCQHCGTELPLPWYNYYPRKGEIGEHQTCIKEYRDQVFQQLIRH